MRTLETRASQPAARTSTTTTLTASGLTSRSCLQVDWQKSHHDRQECFCSGTYIFKMAINPEYKVPEMTFENNAALCNLHYNEVYASITNCSHVRP